jgi:hypothetical protein
MICQKGLDEYGYERTAQATTTHRVYALGARTVAASERLLRWPTGRRPLLALSL